MLSDVYVTMVTVVTSQNYIFIKNTSKYRFFLAVTIKHALSGKTWRRKQVESGGLD